MGGSFFIENGKIVQFVQPKGEKLPKLNAMMQSTMSNKISIDRSNMIAQFIDKTKSARGTNSKLSRNTQISSVSNKMMDGTRLVSQLGAVHTSKAKGMLEGETINQNRGMHPGPGVNIFQQEMSRLSKTKSRLSKKSKSPEPEETQETIARKSFWTENDKSMRLTHTGTKYDEAKLPDKKYSKRTF